MSVGTAARPAGRGHGVDGPACPERELLDQGYLLDPPQQAMCIRCGRVTARRDTDNMPWCGGELPTPAPTDPET